MVPLYRPSVPPLAMLEPTEKSVMGRLEMAAAEVIGAAPSFDIADDAVL